MTRLTLSIVLAAVCGAVAGAPTPVVTDNKDPDVMVVAKGRP